MTLYQPSYSYFNIYHSLPSLPLFLLTFLGTCVHKIHIPLSALLYQPTTDDTKPPLTILYQTTTDDTLPTQHWRHFTNPTLTILYQPNTDDTLPTQHRRYFTNPPLTILYQPITDDSSPTHYSRPSVIWTPFIRTLANLNTIFGNYNDIHWNFAVH